VSATRLKFVAEIIAGQSPPLEHVSGLQQGLPFLQGNAEFGEANPRARLECSRAPKLAKKGDLLLSVRAPVGALNVADQDYGIGRGLNAIRARSIDSRYVFWLLSDSRSYLDSVATGSTFAAVTAANVGSIAVPFTSPSDQRQIADYLDAQTAKIDALIGKQERLIETLAERRQAVISHAVTKGLDPNAPMKESGVVWIGEAPEHWAVGNIRRFASMRTGHTPSRAHPEYWIDCSIPWFTLADVWQLRAGQRYLGDTKGTISEVGLANSAAELLPTGTVVLSRTASVGFTGIMPMPMATSQDFWNWICGPELDPTYLWFQFYAMQPHFASIVQGSTHKTIYQGDAASLVVVAPSLSDQKLIVAYLDRETSQIDALSAKAREMIDVLKERRQALISAAVTGKIDVRPTEAQ